MSIIYQMYPSSAPASVSQDTTTRQCPFFADGHCESGSQCQFQHDQHAPATTASSSGTSTNTSTTVTGTNSTTVDPTFSGLASLTAQNMFDFGQHLSYQAWQGQHYPQFAGQVPPPPPSSSAPSSSSMAQQLSSDQMQHIAQQYADAAAQQAHYYPHTMNAPTMYSPTAHPAPVGPMTHSFSDKVISRYIDEEDEDVEIVVIRKKRSRPTVELYPEYNPTPIAELQNRHGTKSRPQEPSMSSGQQRADCPASSIPLPPSPPMPGDRRDCVTEKEQLTVAQRERHIERDKHDIQGQHESRRDKERDADKRKRHEERDRERDEKKRNKEHRHKDKYKDKDNKDGENSNKEKVTSPTRHDKAVARPNRLDSSPVSERSSAPSTPTRSLEEWVRLRQQLESSQNRQKQAERSGPPPEQFKEPKRSQKKPDEVTPIMWSPKAPSESISAPSASSSSPIRTQNNPIASIEKERAQLTLLAYDPAEDSYEPVVKAKQRVAHEERLTKMSDKRPVHPIGIGKKVPLLTRKQYLAQFIKEIIKISKDDANIVEIQKEAMEEERKICDRALSKTIYMSLAANQIKRFRDRAGIQTIKDDDYVNGNKVVSHSQIISGKGTGTYSIERKRKPSDPSELSGADLYERLSSYCLSLSELEDYGYPLEDPDRPDCPRLPKQAPIRVEEAISYTCDRCQKVYYVDAKGFPIMKSGPCIYHSGRLWQERFNKSMERRYSCCKGEPSSGGCSSCPHHVHLGADEHELRTNYVRTRPKPGVEPNRHGVFALDCEMCYTTVGLELTRVTVINHKCDTIYERLVKPVRPILDYNSKFSGINDGDLDKIETSLDDVHRDLLDLFSDQSILVGHSLDSDLRALKMIHYKVIDTAQMFPHKRGLPYKRALRTLMRECLSKIIQEDAGHDSKEDASACMQLVLWKAKTDGIGKKAKT